MNTYICKACNIKFDAEGTRTEYIDPAYGPCWKMTAECPDCKNECEEFRYPKQQKSYSPPACSGQCSSCHMH